MPDFFFLPTVARATIWGFVTDSDDCRTGSPIYHSTSDEGNFVIQKPQLKHEFKIRRDGRSTIFERKWLLTSKAFALDFFECLRPHIIFYNEGNDPESIHSFCEKLYRFYPQSKISGGFHFRLRTPILHQTGTWYDFELDPVRDVPMAHWVWLRDGFFRPWIAELIASQLEWQSIIINLHTQLAYPGMLRQAVQPFWPSDIHTSVLFFDLEIPRPIRQHAIIGGLYAYDTGERQRSSPLPPSRLALSRSSRTVDKAIILQTLAVLECPL
ncbi:hypothetical protein Micbo1qcDRAFT_181051 [Microdochium bolleyi]|uniref:Uncharacterized protein n=1 Tax=Microdochium bolleyi TaxID=196109 RepID=A0A136IJQ5_9PEZI|nr:hypothetical protein Micbo1qcDRAFT_181051 [Microdochium bolleyi]